jgi:two-component system, oxyanion-binding sensor
MSETIRLGLLRLCDAAPVILAQHEAMFSAAGLQVALSVEPSWANIADKLSYGLLDGAVMLAPLAMACAAGLRGRQVGLSVPVNLSSNGNAITLSTGCAQTFAEGGMSALAVAKRLRLAVVHGYSTHDLLLRHWLQEQNIVPDRDVDITVLPPAEMVGSLAAGAIDGFCAGAPWGEVAVKAGIGFIALCSREIWPDHAEKCFALRNEIIERDTDGMIKLLRVLLAAGARCAVPEGREALAKILSGPDYLDLPAVLLAAALDPDAGGPVFSMPYPDAREGGRMAREMMRWNKAPAAILDVPARLYRADLYEAAGGVMPEKNEADSVAFDVTPKI